MPEVNIDITPTGFLGHDGSAPGATWAANPSTTCANSVATESSWSAASSINARSAGSDSRSVALAVCAPNRDSNG